MLTSAIALFVVAQSGAFTGPSIEVNLEGGKKFVISTDQKGSPKTTARIVELVKEKFYDGIRFHRIESWVVQWGDPKTKKSMSEPGIGSGGSGKNMPFEESKVSFLRGVVGIASTGTKVGGDSQLFVLTKDAPHLNGNYAVLGKVVVGMDAVDSLQVGSKIVSMRVLPERRQRTSSAKG